MRPYPPNSPQAAARIVALTLLSDGQLCRREREMLERLQVARQLGLDSQQLHQVVHELCEDLLVGAASDWAGACRLDGSALGALMDELTEPALRRRVLAQCLALAEADGRLADGEVAVLDAALQRWAVDEAPRVVAARSVADGRERARRA